MLGCGGAEPAAPSSEVATGGFAGSAVFCFFFFLYCIIHNFFHHLQIMKFNLNSQVPGFS